MNSKQKNIPYPKIYYRLLFFLFAAHYVVSYGEPEDFFTLLQLPYYYYALLSSFIIALIVSEFLLGITRYLDKVKPWILSFRDRLWLQLLFGGFLTVVLAVLLATGYFYIRGKNIIEAGYFKYDFTLVVCFVVFLNLIYHIIAQMHGLRPGKQHLPGNHKPAAVNHSPTDVAAIYPVG